MTPERIAELRAEVAECSENNVATSNGAVDEEWPGCPVCPVQTELLDEIDRLSALVATRPPTHELRLEASDWHGSHPITCPLAGCDVVTAAVADSLFEAYGLGEFVHDPVAGSWSPKPDPVPLEPTDAAF